MGLLPAMGHPRDALWGSYPNTGVGLKIRGGSPWPWPPPPPFDKAGRGTQGVQLLSPPPHPIGTDASPNIL